MANPIQTEVSSVEATAKADVSKVEATVTADLAKTYSGKVVLAAAGIALVVGFIVGEVVKF